MKNELAALEDFARRMTREAGALTLRRFRGDLAVESKDDDTAVTLADRECEAHMREMLAREFPGHGVVGEEFGADAKSETWVLDPIDGTLSFITGSPLFSVLAAYAREGVARVGVIHLPASGDTWSGVLPDDASGAAGAATFNGSPCRVSGLRALRRAKCAVTTLGWKSAPADRALRRMLDSAGRTRLGGDGFNYGCVASGFADLAADYDMAVYDYLAPAVVVAAAGGVMTDWAGKPLTLDSGKTEVLAACSAELHRDALAALNSG